jgi:hypothetical protein
MEESMAWDRVEFWESWHDADCDELYDISWNKLSAKHNEIREAIEEEGVAIGL